MILALTEHEDGKFKSITPEVLTLARRLGSVLEEPVGAAILGSGVGELAGNLEAVGLEKVFIVDDPALTPYTSDGYLAALKVVQAKTGPSFVIGGHSGTGLDLLPRLAAGQKRPLVAGCVDFEKQGERFFLTRQIFNGKMNMRVLLGGEPPYFATIAPGAFPSEATAARPVSEGAEDNDGATVVTEQIKTETLNLDLGKALIRQRVLGRERAPGGQIDFGSASTIVAGGRGLKEKENVRLITELAHALGGAVGASRPVVDAEWLPREHQIGSSGQTVSPKLYFAIGISGAIQHLVGMQTAQCIVAINKDADAPIFKVARYGIVGDLFEIVPEVTKTINELKALASRVTPGWILGKFDSD